MLTSHTDTGKHTELASSEAANWKPLTTIRAPGATVKKVSMVVVNGL